MRILLTVSSCYVAYVWGANDVANASSLISGGNILSVFQSNILIGIAMFLGAVIFGNKVAENVGFNITRLSAPMGVCADFACAFVIHLFTRMSVPVSTTHALVGAICGVGFAR